MSLSRHLLSATLSLLLGLPALLVGQDSRYFTNVTFGLLCDSGGADHVCVATRSIMVTGDSRCVDNYQTTPCTRYGFSFDYDLPGDIRTLDCTFSSSIPQRHISPDSVLTADEVSFQVSLPSKRGHYVSQQATLLGPGLAHVNTERQACSHNGHEVFDIEYTVTYGKPSTTYSDLTGLWQFPQRAAWIRIDPDSIAFQCRVDTDGTVYRSMGRVSPASVVHWDSVWAPDTLKHTPDSLFLRGVYGSFGYMRATSPMDTECGA